MQKTNFKCPKCKKRLIVGKKLHASYECPFCHYTMLLTRQDVRKGWKPYRNWFNLDSRSKKKSN